MRGRKTASLSSEWYGRVVYTRRSKEGAAEQTTGANQPSVMAMDPIPAVSSEDDEGDGRNETYSEGGPTTPDVESVLEFLKTVINTPQSTSFIFSIANRVWGCFANEIISEF